MISILPKADQLDWRQKEKKKYVIAVITNFQIHSFGDKFSDNFIGANRV